MFFRKHEIDPFSVADKVTFRNVDNTIEMKVRADASLIVVNLTKARKRIEVLNDNSSDEDKRSAAMAFAGAIFGMEQAEKLLEFYGCDALAVIVACGKYFSDRLSKKITKAQKK